MTEQQIDTIVNLILQRLQPAVLVMVTSADGYRDLIHQRLARCRPRLHLALDAPISDTERWQQIADVIPAKRSQHKLPSTPYKALLLPFLSYPLAVDIVNGTLQSPVAQRVHDALLAGIPVLALRYYCDPHSELNALRGTVHSDYAAHLSATLTGLSECGITLCSMNEMLEKLATDGSSQSPVSHHRRYLTVTDIVNNPALAKSPDAVLTDAAVDFLKAQKK